MSDKPVYVAGQVSGQQWAFRKTNEKDDDLWGRHGLEIKQPGNSNHSRYPSAPKGE